MFDHLYSILPQFGLYAYQQPSGRDFRKVRVIEDVSHSVLSGNEEIMPQKTGNIREKTD